MKYGLAHWLGVSNSSGRDRFLAGAIIAAKNATPDLDGGGHFSQFAARISYYLFFLR